MYRTCWILMLWHSPFGSCPSTSIPGHEKVDWSSKTTRSQVRQKGIAKLWSTAGGDLHYCAQWTREVEARSVKGEGGEDLSNLVHYISQSAFVFSSVCLHDPEQAVDPVSSVPWADGLIVPPQTPMKNYKNIIAGILYWYSKETISEAS